MGIYISRIFGISHHFHKADRKFLKEIENIFSRKNGASTSLYFLVLVSKSKM